MRSPHALVLPFPALGHINPLMDLSHFLSNHGFKTTFINPDYNQNIISSNDRIHIISIPGEISSENRLLPAFEKIMLVWLEHVIHEINEGEEEEKITCLIADCGMAYVLAVAEKMGLQGVAFCPASGTHLAVSYLSIPKLMEDGVIDENGFPRNQEKFRPTPTTPLMNLTNLTWNYIGDLFLKKYTGDLNTQQIIFHYFKRCGQALSKAHFILSNSCQDLELPIFLSFPNICSIGPLPTFGTEMTGYYSEDPTCITWLDQQQPNSVVYVSFGSVAKLEDVQFQEIGLGLELSQMKFLWITRPDLTDGDTDIFLSHFQERVKERGKIAEWCDQKMVLAHPSIVCFVSHCGWNSTMEGVTNGLKFLCWPYFADQFANRDYICDVLKVGLRLVENENGIVTKENIKSSLNELMKDDEMKGRAEKLKEIVNKSITEGGSSFTNLFRFVEAMKQ